jgi:hypothetical protein
MKQSLILLVFLGFSCLEVTDPVQFPLDSVTFSPEAGGHALPIDVTLSTSTGGTTIYYTVDGSDPKINGIDIHRSHHSVVSDHD